MTEQDPTPSTRRKLKRYRIQWGYRDDGVWHNDVVGCSYTVEAPNERGARKQVRALLKRRTLATTRIAWVTELPQ